MAVSEFGALMRKFCMAEVTSLINTDAWLCSSDNVGICA